MTESLLTPARCYPVRRSVCVLCLLATLASSVGRLYLGVASSVPGGSASEGAGEQDSAGLKQGQLACVYP